MINEKKILVFSNGEKIGDGIIKLPLLNEIKKRLPNYKLIWMTDKGTTVYNKELKNISSLFIDEIIEKANLNPFFWQNISDNYDLSKMKFEYILDTQKAVFRTISLKRIKSSIFISATAAGFFSTKKIIKNKKKIRKYYLEDLYTLLNLIKNSSVDNNFKFPLPQLLENKLRKIFTKNNNYIGIAPGAGEKDKIWSIDNFIEVGKYFEKKSYSLVFFLGPSEKKIKSKIFNVFPKALFPEDMIKDYSGTEIVIAATKFLSCAITNDSGASHMLSTKYCPLIKLFGPKDANKFTISDKRILTIKSDKFGSKDINEIPVNYVIKKTEEFIK